MRILRTKLYTIDEHPNKVKCFDWMRDNMHDLNSCDVDELILGIKAFTKEFGGTHDYAIGQFPMRGEFISITGYDKEAFEKATAMIGVLNCSQWAYELVKVMKETGYPSGVLKLIHQASEDVYSDEGLEELCRGMDYEFTEEGVLI